MGFFDSIASDLGGKGLLGGNFQIRLILQPLIAVFLGLRFGIRDAKEGRMPILMALARTKGERGKIFKGAIRDVVVPLCVAFVLDSILQHINNHRIRPLGAVIVGGLLMFLPFMIVRALANRAWTHRHSGPGRQVRAT